MSFFGNDFLENYMSEINQAQNEQQELQLENLRFELHKERAKLQQEWAKLKTQEAEFNRTNPKFPFNMQDYVSRTGSRASSALSYSPEGGKIRKF
jgi:multidrug resistance efflux pump